MFYELTDAFIVDADLQETWKFFSSAENLPRITPPWLAFSIQTPHPIEIADGALLDYTIRWMGLPIRWRTRIIDWTPPRQFIDLQLRGPYAVWHHQHTFSDGDAGVECRDRVLYKLPGGVLAAPVHEMIVRRQLLGIFRFRRRVIGEALGWRQALQPDVAIRRIK